MTGTKRIYNKLNVKKAQRIDLRRLPPGLKEQVESGEINNPLRNAIHTTGLLYHPYAQLCMGKCPMCRDPALDPKRVRKVKKTEFMKQLKDEMDKEDKVLDDIDGDNQSV